MILSHGNQSGLNFLTFSFQIWSENINWGKESITMFESGLDSQAPA